MTTTDIHAEGSLAVHRLDRVSSTQDVLHALAADGAPAGTAVVAAEQTAGKGSRGRAWHSPRGGLWLSVLFRPASPASAEVLSLRAGLAVAAALDAIGGLPRVRLKWPNDLLLDGRKAGGILCEARWQGDGPGSIALGVGLNIANQPPDDIAATAARLGDWRPTLRPADLVAPMVAALRAIDAVAAELTAAELAAFEARDWLRDRRLRGPVTGVAVGIAGDGTLLVQRDDGTVEAVRSGSVVVAACY